jgi:glucose/arabinose dehydrogenase
MTEHLNEEQLNTLADGSLDAALREGAERHLAGCAECRREVERLRVLVADARALPRAIEPGADLWPGVAARLGRRALPRWLAAAAVVVVALGAMVYVVGRGKAADGWVIAEVEGTPRLEGRPMMRSVLRPGDALDTDSVSRVRLHVGTLGTVRVEPGSRVRLLASTPAEQRLALARGTISARIVAPARVFVVETPAALAVDLGCAYELTTDSAGNGRLHVTSGWVELTNGKRVTVVPRDAYTTIRAGHGPGTAYARYAPAELLRALEAWDFAARDGADVTALRAVLRAARRRLDGITLLNLLTAVPDSLRAEVYERLAGLAPPPARVTRELALALDRVSLNRWWDDLVPPRLELDPDDPKGRIKLSSQALNRGELALEPVASGLSMPLHLTAPAGDGRLFVVEQVGRIRIVRDGKLLDRPFLDIVSKVSSGGERGLLSLAFHPRYATNGWFYVNYTDRGGDTHVERYRVSTEPDVADPASASTVLRQDQPYANHNGGHILFGPDGMLYLGMGDGGSGGDPHGYGQSRGTLLGKLLRIDVDRSEPYAIPPDNPFVGAGGSRPEIWAYGLRNPWRIAFDRPTGLLYIADVGQSRWEEVNVQPARAAGLNYGWNRMEGDHCYGLPVCTKGGFVRPAVEYNHADGCSITGGMVYRGRRLPFLTGHYLYSDYCSGFLRSFTYEDGVVTGQRTWDVGALGAVLSFGEDAAGEIYVLSADGTVRRVVEKR